jgi:hypothetical protein
MIKILARRAANVELPIHFVKRKGTEKDQSFNWIQSERNRPSNISRLRFMANSGSASYARRMQNHLRLQAHDYA